MPAHPPQWTDFLLCSHCTKKFSPEPDCWPITLICGHSICKGCIAHLQAEGCRHDQNTKTPNLSLLPPNSALLQIVAYQSGDFTADVWRAVYSRQPLLDLGHNYEPYITCMRTLGNLARHLVDIKNGILPQRSDLTKPMLRKLVCLIQCQLVLEHGRLRALSACRALAERVSTELILAHQNPATLSGNLWTAVRARGCQFLGPAMQEEALKLIHLALEDGSELSRKVLVMFVVQKLQQQFPQASKTCIGHVVQLLYRASCFVVKKRDQDSSLMKLKENYRTFSALRREHDTQIVQIAREAGLRIAPDQWSALLYGDQGQKSHMQSIIDRLQSGESLKRCIQDLENALDKSSNPQKLKAVIPNFEVLSEISDDYTDKRDSQKNNWNFLKRCLQSVEVVIEELISFMENHSQNSWRDEEALAQSAKFKTSFCRDMKSKGRCPRGTSCTFAHSEEELRLYRNKRKKANLVATGGRDKTWRSRPQQDEVGSSEMVVESHLQEEYDEKDPVLDPPNAMPSQGEPNPQPQYYAPHPYAPSPIPNQPPVIPVNPHPPPANLPAVPSAHYGVRPQFPGYHYPNYDGYQQRQLPFSPSQNNIPYVHTIPERDVRSGQNSSGELSQKPFVMADPNLSQFTVTVSFQPNSNQRSNQYQSSSTPTQRGTAGAIVQLADENTATQLQRNSFVHQDIAKNAHDNLRGEPARNATLTANPIQPEHMPGYYSMPPQYNQGNFPPQGGPGIPVNPVMYHRVDSPVYHCQMVTPDSMPHRPIAPSPNPTPTHLYGPNTNTIIPQNPSVGHSIRNRILPQASPQTPQPAQQMFIPVMPIPVTQYQVQVADQGAWPTKMKPQMRPIAPQISLVHSGAIVCTKEQGVRDGVDPETVEKFLIPKSIDDASVRELEHRKGQILNQMIRNQRKEAISLSPERHYDIWRSSSEHPPTNDGRSGLVDVIADLDTGTKQVTMRDGDHINPSPAHDERILDDVKMHEIVLERYHVMNSTANVSHANSNPHMYIRYTSGSPGDEDEVIPFSDRPMVSKYGPIARTRTGTNNSGSNQQMNDHADAQTMSSSLDYDPPNEVESSSVYSSFETLHAPSCSPFSTFQSREPLDGASGKVLRDLPITSSFQRNSISLSQATLNTRLVHREQAALQQNRAQSDTEDLELAMELQQIEIGIRQKKQKRAAIVKVSSE